MNQNKNLSIDPVIESYLRIAAPTTRTRLSYNAISMASGLLLVLDILCLLLASSIATLLYLRWFAPLGIAPDFLNACAQATLVATVLAPFVLYDKRFGASASRGHMLSLAQSHLLRFTLFSTVVAALIFICQTLVASPGVWLALWFFISLPLTASTRILVAQSVRYLQRRGVLTEVIAVVGAGPVAERLVQTLRQTRPETFELLGVFDDKVANAPSSTLPLTGNLAQLIELGKTRKIDWILLTLPPTAEQRVSAIVQRLKALSVPIGLCPQHIGLTAPYRAIDDLDDSVPVSLLSDRPVKRWNALFHAAEDYLPRWIITLAWLPLSVLEALADKLVKWALGTTPPRAAPLTFQFDNYDLAGFTQVATQFGQNRYGYVVTPNADHMIRLNEDASYRTLYAAADYILLDSRFLAHVLRFTKSMILPVCTGSDLTAKLFSDVIAPNDRLVLIGGSEEQARQLSALYGLRNLAHFNPPMGFIRDPQAVEECLNFIETHSPFRFCLLAVGAPQQEVLAQRLKARGIARGLALCIGASINFLTGDERRAPVWMQRLGIEWFYRLTQAPGRMAKRYLVRGPRVFGLLRNAQIVLRRDSAPVPQVIPPLIFPSSTVTELAARERVVERIQPGRFQSSGEKNAA